MAIYAKMVITQIMMFVIQSVEMQKLFKLKIAMTVPMTLKAVYLTANQGPGLSGSVKGETQYLQLNASQGAEMEKLLEMRHAMMAINLTARGVSRQTVLGTSLGGTA